MKKIFVICIMVAASIAAYAQSFSDINAVRSLAKQYGYSEDEINAILNKENNQEDSKSSTLRKKKTSAYGVPDQALPGDLDYKGFQIPIEVAPLDSLAEKTEVFGHDFFVSKGLSLIPSVTAPVPESYILGPGDEITVSVWGATNASYDLKVRSDGNIILPNVGPVSVSGSKLSAVEKLLQSRLAEYYPGLSDKTTGLQVTVGRIRGVSVYVLGEVQTPGVYTLPSLCNIPTAIYMAGGIRPLGSVRKINLFRGGKKIDTFDVYDFILDGNQNIHSRLQDGDIISAEAAGPIVTVSGEVRRERKYEVKEDETLSSIVKFSGGFNACARRDVIHVDRITSNGGISFDVPAEMFMSFKLQDGDEISVKKGDEEFKNRVSIYGNVVNEGYYAISDKLKTVKDLITAAGGLKEGSFMERAYICRLNDDRLPVQVSFKLQDIVDGAFDINLVKDDEVSIYSNQDVMDPNICVTIFGEINYDGEYQYREGMTLGDLLLLAGGAKDGADLSRVEVASRGREEEPSINSFDLTKDTDALNTKLNPYDKVYVKSLENYRDLKTILVKGEVKYPGFYAVEKGNVRLSDIISRASGFTDDAFIPGARLKRKVQESDIEAARFIKRIAELNKYKLDSTYIEQFSYDGKDKNENPTNQPKYQDPNISNTTFGPVDPSGSSKSKSRPRTSNLPRSSKYADANNLSVPQNRESQLDSLSMNESLKSDEYYSIAIDLQAAMNKPGSDADLILNDGDILDVPQMNNTVKISGGVYLPNVVAFNPDLNWRDYVNLAGGPVKGAMMRKIFAVYQDGSSAVRGSSRFRMEPGMELIVPQKEAGEKSRLTPGEWAALASAVTSITSVIVILINQLSR